MSNDVRINNNNSKKNNNNKKKKQEKKINETFILSTAYVWNKLYTNTTTSLNNFRVTTDIKMSPRKPVLAALLMLSKCLCCHYYVYSFLLHWVEFKLELMRKSYASQRIYVSISFTGLKFSLASGRKPRLPTSSQGGRGPGEQEWTRLSVFTLGRCACIWTDQSGFSRENCTFLMLNACQQERHCTRVTFLTENDIKFSRNGIGN